MPQVWGEREIGDRHNGFFLMYDPPESVLYDMWALVGRYGHQPLSEAKNMAVHEIKMFVESLSRIIERENEPVNKRSRK